MNILFQFGMNILFRFAWCRKKPEAPSRRPWWFDHAPTLQGSFCSTVRFLEMIHERVVLTPHYLPLKKIMSCVWHTRHYDIIFRWWNNYIEQTIELKTCTLQTRRSKTSSKGVDHKCELIFRKSKIELLPVRSSRLQLQLQACPCPLQSECNNRQTVVDKERQDKA